MALYRIAGRDARGAPYRARAEAVDESVLREALACESMTLLSVRRVPLTRWPFVGQGWPILAWPAAGLVAAASLATAGRAVIGGAVARSPGAFLLTLALLAGSAWFVHNILGRLGSHWLLDEARGVWLYTRSAERPALRSDEEDPGEAG